MNAIYRTEAGGRAVIARYREILAAWPVPNEQLRIPTAQGETFVIASGTKDAPPLVLLHGAGGNSLTWMRDVPAWAAHFRVYAVDVIGDPGLSAPSRPPLDGDHHAKWLGEVFDALSLTRARFVGVSLGGWLALDFATRHPERVERLVLLCPGGVGKQKAGFVLKAVPLLMMGNWGRKKALALALGSKLESGDAATSAYLMSVFKEFRARRVKLPIFSDAQLARLTMPVLLIVSRLDAMLDSKGTVARLARTAADLSVRDLPDTGHLITGQMEAIAAFLQGASIS
jgi:pimeloyl-ACP methyl ester carboxylesterase